MSLQSLNVPLNNTAANIAVGGPKTLTITNGNTGPLKVKVKLGGNGSGDPSELTTVTTPVNFSFDDSATQIFLEVLDGDPTGATAKLSGNTGRADPFNMAVPATGVGAAIDLGTGTIPIPYYDVRTFLFSDGTPDTVLHIEGSADNVTWVICKTREGADAIVRGANKLVTFEDANRYYRLRRVAGSSGAMDLCCDAQQSFVEVLFAQFIGESVTPTGFEQNVAAANNKLACSTGINLVQNSSGGALTLTSTPTIDPFVTGGEVTFVNVGTNTITLQDNATLAGSNLYLGAATRVLAQWSQITLMFVANKWIEKSFTA